MKTLCVFSGGLDSLLAAELLRAQDIEVLGLFLETPFFSSGRARKSAAGIRLPLRVVDLSLPHLEIVKRPKHGYGGNMNPCIDCHALMLRTAGNMLEEENADFIITGEVLGQRPMSQNKKALSIVASESGYERLILRPLSARLLPVTVPEEKGWVDREGLMDFSGRSRKPQMALAERFQIRDYPAPAGGCLLTDEVFSRRLKDLLGASTHMEIREIELLKCGRHFRMGPRTKLIVGRNKKENEEIASLSRHGDLLLKTEDIPGPVGLMVGESTPELEALGASIVASYSDAKAGESVQVSSSGRGPDTMAWTTKQDKELYRSRMV